MLVLNDLRVVLLSGYFLCAFVVDCVRDHARIHGVFLFREEDFTKSMYPALSGSSNAHLHCHPHQTKINLICDVMRVAMEHIDPQK